MKIRLRPDEVMDSLEFPFIQAELCLQFHDDSQAVYPAAFHALRGVLERRGRLQPSRCPGNYICADTLVV